MKTVNSNVVGVVKRTATRGTREEEMADAFGIDSELVAWSGSALAMLEQVADLREEFLILGRRRRRGSLGGLGGF